MTDYKPFFLLVILVTWFLLKQLFVYPDYRSAPINFKALFGRQQQLGEVDNNETAAAVACQPECWFEIDQKQVPARLSGDAAGQLRQLNLRFIDEKRGLIGYDNASQTNPEFYVLSFDKELIQVIQLDLNHRRRLEFGGYYPSTQQIKFNSSDGHAWLYSAGSPSLVSI
ncbi:MAG: hypothetical protein UY17_C0011G0007 [Candidatus Beckwithbacteria bacterium GW2011_GWC2_47_9]|uniref:Uncharacterized protein n=1 Tax=Candidatus Beckwithbacteria bacterium GW2011_GWC2_47_9 TaxID=1618373 RepID=A0A0G1WZR7_9BACT|nr:MAG: hypothetical protein UW72_C0011G0003 [Parcubacteria group bacterium GW2011_GWF2_44_7]KKU87685.1 MAG: hypothetical protein UY17_C0011G0007 [Candidatus Beckwithbacteria bacterium GW2011_GWC2_47_9]